MRHQKKKYILSRKKSPRTALKRGLMSSLIRYRQLKTTLAKAKAIRPGVEKLITLAKTDNLTNRRQAKLILRSDVLVKKLFTDIAPQFKDRHGGYTRIVKIGFRQGDGAPIANIELINL